MGLSRKDLVDILYLLIPLSAVLILAIVAVFGWAIHSGQFDDVEREGERPLQEDAPPEGAASRDDRPRSGP